MVPLIAKHQADSKVYKFGLSQAKERWAPDRKQAAENMENSEYPNHRDDLQLILFKACQAICITVLSSKDTITIRNIKVFLGRLSMLTVQTSRSRIDLILLSGNEQKFC